MKNCPQTNNQSVYEHGVSVKNHVFELIEILKTNKINIKYKLPNWFLIYKKDILNSLCDEKIIEEYTTFHDCSKPYCRFVDENGKQHFPNHAELSAKIWKDIGGSEQAQKLMKMDMLIHTMKAIDIDDFIKNKEAITLLLTGLAEIHSNAEMFGGINSDSFKIKYNQIDRRGNSICKKLFGEK